MKPAFLGTIKKNLFGIITAVLSAGVLLGFLFSADGIASLARISQNMRYERSRGKFRSVFPLFFSEETIIPAMVVWRTMSYYLNFPIGCICTYIADRLPKLSFGSEKMKECA